MRGNNALATGGSLNYGASANYVVLNTKSPSAPVVQANVVDVPTSDIFNPQSAAWASSNTFYTADGTGGMAVYDRARQLGIHVVRDTIRAKLLFGFYHAIGPDPFIAIYIRRSSTALRVGVKI